MMNIEFHRGGHNAITKLKIWISWLFAILQTEPLATVRTSLCVNSSTKAMMSHSIKKTQDYSSSPINTWNMWGVSPILWNSSFKRVRGEENGRCKGVILHFMISSAQALESLMLTSPTFIYLPPQVAKKKKKSQPANRREIRPRRSQKLKRQSVWEDWWMKTKVRRRRFHLSISQRSLRRVHLFRKAFRSRHPCHLQTHTVLYHHSLTTILPLAFTVSSRGMYYRHD